MESLLLAVTAMMQILRFMLTLTQSWLYLRTTGPLQVWAWCISYYSKREDYMGESQTKFDSNKKVTEVGRGLWNILRDNSRILALLLISIVILCLYQNAVGKEGGLESESIPRGFPVWSSFWTPLLAIFTQCTGSEDLHSNRCVPHWGLVNQRKHGWWKQDLSHALHCCCKQYFLEVKLMLLFSLLSPCPPSLMVFLLLCLFVLQQSAVCARATSRENLSQWHQTFNTTDLLPFLSCSVRQLPSRY